MRLRLLLALGALGALAVVVAVRGSGRGVGEDVRRAPVAPAPPAPAPSRSEAEIDPAAIRDVFRYGDEPRAGLVSVPRPGSRVGGHEASGLLPPPRARLVGLVRRGSRLVAALAIDGEVMLLGPGESAGGYTILAVGDEDIRLRGPDGREETLALP